MKRFIFSIIIMSIVLIPNHLFSQIQGDEVLRQTLMITLKKHNTSNSEYITKVDEDAKNFDVEQFISDNIATTDIRIIGTTTSIGKTIKIDFDSKKIGPIEDCNKFCKKITSVEKQPVLGVTLTAMDDLQGVLVENVFEGSAAEYAGIQQGDIITYAGESIVQSGCDITIIMSEAKVGEVMDIEIINGDTKEIRPVVLGYKILEKVTYDFCCLPEVAADQVTNQNSLTVFPNPTDGLFQLNYQSFDNQNVKVSITDISGRIIYQEEIKEFSGFLNESFDLTKYADGMYFLQVIQGEEIFSEKIILQQIK